MALEKRNIKVKKKLGRHIENGVRATEQERQRESSSSRFSGLCRSVSVAEWTVPVFVPVPVSRCHQEARRYCFRIERPEVRAAPSLSPPSSLPSTGRGAGRGRGAWLQTELVTPKRELEMQLRNTHVHLLLFCRGIPGFLVNTGQLAADAWTLSYVGKSPLASYVLLIHI
ncbi:hypothetical protein NQZ68_018364 [Dissostichus eleginoides]|nr:hypothetical protein NQZ68_018364 [Dissostichus eleginoides]